MDNGTLVCAPVGDDKGRSPRGAPTDKTQKYKWGLQDAPGRLQMIHKSNLLVDHAYQRQDINNNRVLRLAQDWSWIACGVLLVGRRPDGVMVIIDGQHRWLAACKRSEIGELPCVVFECASVQSEARGFYNANCVRGPLKSAETFRALVIAGNPDAVEVDRMIRDSGYTVARNAGSQFTIGCVGTILTAHQRDKDITRLCWKLVCDLSNGVAINGVVFGGLFYLESKLRSCNSDQSISDQHNRDKLVDAGLDAIVNSIGKAKAYFARGGDRVFAQGIVDLLNKGRRTRALPAMTSMKEEASTIS